MICFFASNNKDVNWLQQLQLIDNVDIVLCRPKCNLNLMG